jgi:hypothetical protein
MRANEFVTEAWSQKYKKSINCSHPRGFSQKAHCAGKKKHNESTEMETVCEDCGMCETHGDHSKNNLDEACWKGYHKEGNKKMVGKSYPNCVKNTKEDIDEAGRVARKPGQPADSKKHSDLYTDENPQGTITGLKFATVEDAKSSVSKIRNSGRSHAHKIQAAVAMEQRAKAAGKASAAAVYRAYINAKKKTNEQQLDEKCWDGYSQQGMKKKGFRMVPNCVPVSEEQDMTSDQVRRIQQMLNQEHGANLDVDGEMGPLTLQSIRKFLPQAGQQTAPDPDRNTAVQGYEKKMSTQELEENLRDWFKDKWVRFGPDGKIRGDCARGSSKEGKPKCLPQAKAHALGKKGRASAAARKRREDPNPNRSGAAINVSTKGKRK